MAGFAPDAKLQLAQAQLAAGEVSAAQAGFASALEGDPGHAAARRGLAQSAFRRGEPEGAERAFEEVLGLGGDRSTLATALRGLAELRRAAGDRAAAAELLSQADSLAEGSQTR